MEQTDLKLIIDAGNTRIKLYLFRGKELLDTLVSDHESQQLQQEWLARAGKIRSVIISNVSAQEPPLLATLAPECPLVRLNHTTPIPIRNLYQTPETLGSDRLAAAVGGYTLFPNNPVLVIDAGTCINYEFVNQGAYHGGLIAPGIEMQAHAMHHFTGKLPLVEPSPLLLTPLTGTSTREVLLSGIIHGTIASVEGIINRFSSLYNDLKVILSGGDLFYFENPLKNRIFAAPNIVAQGLNEILDFHECN